MPTATIVSSAFLMHGRRAAKNLQIEELPLLVTPHPVNDLTPEQVRELARAAYPLIVDQLTRQSVLEETTRIPYARQASTFGKARAEAVEKGEGR